MSPQVNESVLRPASMEPLSDLQLAEELIKQEMITMLHHDCLHHPTNNAASQLQRGKNRGPTSTSNNASHIAYLETHSYKPLSPEEMEQVTTSIGLFYRKKIYNYWYTNTDRQKGYSQQKWKWLRLEWVMVI